MKIKALLPYFGGKRNLAPWIVEELGEHRAYWEPFCGSMAILMAKPPCSMETVNDLHGDLVNLARVIKSKYWGPKFYRHLRRVLMHEDIFNDADNWLRAEPDYSHTLNLSPKEYSGFNEPFVLEENHFMRAYRYFVVSWLGRNGTAGTPISHKGTYCVRYTSSGGHAAKRKNRYRSSSHQWPVLHTARRKSIIQPQRHREHRG